MPHSNSLFPYRCRMSALAFSAVVLALCFAFGRCKRVERFLNENSARVIIQVPQCHRMVELAIDMCVRSNAVGSRCDET
jgi:hypothetical protein